jgi:hypothetical protein
VGLLSLAQPGSNPLSTAFEARTLTITPRMWWLDRRCLFYFIFFLLNRIIANVHIIQITDMFI